MGFSALRSATVVSIALVNKAFAVDFNQVIVGSNFDDADALTVGQLYTNPLPGVATAGESSFLLVDQESAGTWQGTPTSVGSMADSNLAIAVGDVSGDGLPDIVTGNNSTQASVRLGIASADGTYAVSDLVPASNLVSNGITLDTVQGIDVKAVDFDGDGDLDILATVSNYEQTEGFLLFLDNTNGDGSAFATTIIADDLKGIARIEVADLDNDGFQDVVVLQVTNRAVVAYFQGTGGTFSPRILSEPGTAAANLAIGVGRLDNNNFLDVVATGPDNIDIYLSGFFRFYAKNTIFQGVLGSMQSLEYQDWHVDVVDVDDNGMNDIVAVWGLQNGIKVVEQVEENRYRFPETLIAVFNPDALQAADLDGDGLIDYVTHSSSNSNVYAFYALSDEATSTPTVSPVAVPSPTAVVPTAPTTCTPIHGRCFPTSVCCNPEENECNGVCQKKGGTGEIPDSSVGKKLLDQTDRVRGSTRRRSLR